jgi:hypothetical protein
MSDLPPSVPGDEVLEAMLGKYPTLAHYADLHSYEVRNARWCLWSVLSNPRLRTHLAVVDGGLRLLMELASGACRDDNVGELKGLATRLFNSSAASISLLLTGYYQCSFLLQRDVLETGFLLDYFWRSPGEVEVWRVGGRSVRKDKYGPIQIRCELEKADGVNRGKMYEKFCEYAAHPTPHKRLVVRGGTRYTGPMFDSKVMDACLGELAMDLSYFAVVAGHALVGSAPALRTDFESYRAFVKGWAHKAFGLGLGDFGPNDMASWARRLWGSPTSTKA